MYGNPILRPHLVKLINADNSIVSQYHGPSLHAYIQLSSAWDIACTTHPCPGPGKKLQSCTVLAVAGNSIHPAHITPNAGQRQRPIIAPAKCSGSRSAFFLVATCICTGYNDSGSSHQPYFTHHNCSVSSVQINYMMHGSYASRAVPQGRTPHCCPSPQWL